MPILELENVYYSYGNKLVLNNVSFAFEKGKMYAITGRSGVGKTTLLSVLSGLALPSKGTIRYNGEDLRGMDRYRFRSKYIGVIFQSFNLLSKYTAAENVELSMEIANVKTANKKQDARALLERVGLNDDEIDRRILKLSGGQQQWVAIARTLSYGPDIILADEPTGNLDSETEQEILHIFRTLAEEGKCVILVTHSSAVAGHCDVQYELGKKRKKAG